MGEPAAQLEGTPSSAIQVRRNGAYAEEKLTFLDRYVPPALMVTKRKAERHYVELFAGPGQWRTDNSAVVHDGSALRMIAVEGNGPAGPAFTHGTFVNLAAPDHTSLRNAVAERASEGRCRIPPRNLTFVSGDANAVVADLMNGIPRHAYALVVVDFEKPSDWPWTSVASLRRHAPTSTDLYAMMPTHMGLLRMIARDYSRMLDHEVALDRFFGTEEWRPLVVGAHNERLRRELPSKLERLYCRRLQALGWGHVGVVRKVCRRGRQQLYSMIFASNHPVAKTLVNWEIGTKPEVQLGFELAG